MARRTVTITHLQYWKSRARGENRSQDVSNLPDGRDMLTFVHGVWAALPEDRLMNREKQRYAEPIGAQPKGRTLLCIANVGNYGDPASLRDAMTKTEELSHGGELAHTVPVRVFCTVPQAAKSVLLFVEHAAEGSLGTALLDTIKDAWRQEFPGWTLHVETLTRADAWLDSAQLMEVSAQIYGYSPDLADVGVPKMVGTVKSMLTPTKGARWLPHALLEALKQQQVPRAGILGLPEEPDEVQIRLGDGEQSKLFVLGKERTPAVRYLVTDHGIPTLDDAKFRRWCLDEAPDLFRRVGVEWHASWNKGDWSPEALATRVVVEDVDEDGASTIDR